MITSVKIKDNTKTTFEYVSDIEAFENGREFIFKPGVNVIIGKNGSGKSTLLNNNDMVGIFERYKDIADGDMEVAMNFIKEAYLFNEETEVFIRKKFNMSIPVEPEE